MTNCRTPPKPACRWRSLVAAAGLCTAAAAPALAQNGAVRDTPRSTSSGPGVQIDVGQLLRALTGTPRAVAGAGVGVLQTEWPEPAAALAAYSLAPELVRRPAPDGDVACEPGQLLVWWPSAAAAAEGLRELRERLGLEPQQRADLLALGASLAVYQLADNEAALALRTQLRAQHPEWAVDLNARASASAQPRLYALGQLQNGAGPAAASVGSQATPQANLHTGVRIGVIDGPTDAQDDLALSAFRAVSVLLPSDVPASVQHGNTVARLIAARPLVNGFAGAAPGVALHWATVTRLVQGHERSNTLGQVLALDWVLGEGVALVNVSMGGPGDAVLAAAYQRATGKPVLLLAAAGNGGPGAAPVYPAAYPGVLAVTATDALLQVYAWANQGPYLALAAPGVDLWVPLGGSAGNSGSNAGAYFSGTSFATALATATLAHWGEQRLRQAHAERLMPVCKAARDLGAAGKDAVFGCGLVR